MATTFRRGDLVVDTRQPSRELPRLALVVSHDAINRVNLGLGVLWLTPFPRGNSLEVPVPELAGQWVVLVDFWDRLPVQHARWWGSVPTRVVREVQALLGVIMLEP
ncbi:hypothetical protein Dcar01_01817 [Deinococcus carri]|uniref:Type II toxin-antitoxin system PemK/MazF family toxin n=2 Tax=Deinococcus carri TaxID=1211323 RepID=A0ABP9W6U7_9DEIO